MYILYGRPNTGSVPVEALLALLKVPATITDVIKTGTGSTPDWFLALNPRGEVPALRLPDGSVMTESAAMMIYLADAHPQAGLAPAITSPARATYLRWMVYLAASPYTSDLRLYYPDRYSTDPTHAPAIKAKASADLAHDFAVMAAQLGVGPYILGQTFSAVDIYAATLITWSDDMEGLFAKHPNLHQLYLTVSENPVIRKIWDRQELA